MTEFLRLVSYARRYSLALLAAVFLMLVSGVGRAMLPVLLKPVFDRVLDPTTPDSRVPLPVPEFLHFHLYLDQLVSSQAKPRGQSRRN